MITFIELAERMKRDIVWDVRMAVVPAAVAQFSELHAYTDANCYGGTEALLDAMNKTAGEGDAAGRRAMKAFLTIADPAMDLVDAWLRAGGIRKSLLQHRRKMKAHIRQAIIATMEKRKINRNMLANKVAGKVHRSHVYDFINGQKDLTTEKANYLLQALNLQIISDPAAATGAE